MYTINIGLANPFTGDNNSVDKTLEVALVFVQDIVNLRVSYDGDEPTVIIQYISHKGSLDVLATAITTKLYEVITEYRGDTIANYIGVVEGGWDDRIIDTDTDHRVFYFMDQDEFDQLTVGTDLTGDGDVVTDIEREPSYVFEETVDSDRQRSL